MQQPDFIASVYSTWIFDINFQLSNSRYQGMHIDFQKLKKYFTAFSVAHFVISVKAPPKGSSLSEVNMVFSTLFLLPIKLFQGPKNIVYTVVGQRKRNEYMNRMNVCSAKPEQDIDKEVLVLGKADHA